MASLGPIHAATAADGIDISALNKKKAAQKTGKAKKKAKQ